MPESTRTPTSTTSPSRRCGVGCLGGRVSDDRYGYAGLIGWLRQQGRSSGSASSRLAPTRPRSSGRCLRTGSAVVEVNQPHPHARQRRGKSDPIDAELAARAALSGTATAVPKKTSGIVEAIRQLSVARAGALESTHRSAATARRPRHHRARPAARRAPTRPYPEGEGRSLPRSPPRHRLVCTSPLRLQSSPCAALPAASETSTLKSSSSTESSSSSSTPPPRARSSSSESARKAQANSCSPPAKTSTGSEERSGLREDLRRRPIQASSGRTTRHRLDFGGDRQANRALHMIAVCRLPARHCQRTQPTPPNAQPKDSTDAKSSAASSATSPARPTTRSEPIWRRRTPLDIYRNVPTSCVSSSFYSRPPFTRRTRPAHR